jgi:two-component system, sensor histidine kinase YesM
MMIFIQVYDYIRFNNIIQDKAEFYAANTISQANDKLDNTSDNIKKAATAVAYNMSTQKFFTEKDNVAKKEHQDAVYSLIRSMVISNPSIAEIAFIDNEDNIFTANSVINVETLKQLKAQVNLDKIDKPMFASVIQNSTNETLGKYFCYIMPVFNIELQAESDRKLGQCIILGKIQYLQGIVNNTSITSNSLFYMIDSKNQLIVSNKKNINQMMLSTYDAAFRKMYNENTWVKVSYMGNPFMVKEKMNQYTGWKMISIIPINELTSDLKKVRVTGIIIGVITIALLLLAGTTISRSIAIPMARLVKTMGIIGNKNIKQRILLKETNEIGIIAKNINLMLDNIENMTGNIFSMQANLYEVELSKKEAELSALQSQINPHFLYNTLECIRSISSVHDITEIVDISTSMAKIFRYSIKGSNFTSVRQEIECIQDYLVIMCIRFEGKFDTQLNIDSNLMDLKIVKMILQPIAENAMYHGLEPKEGKGLLRVIGYIKENMIFFEIIDNGIGMNEQEVKEINSNLEERKELKGVVLSDKRSIGLGNINNRIKLYYGNEFGVCVYSKINEGTKVIVNLPLVEDKDVNK